VPVSYAVATLIVALIGFADATYLVIEHFRGVVPPCTITAGCELVLTSPFSVVWGIPVALLGSLFYLLIAAGAFAYLESKNEEILRYTLQFTMFGLLASIWFVFLQVFILHSYCAYCMGSALTSTTLFILACIIHKKYQSTDVAVS